MRPTRGVETVDLTLKHRIRLRVREEAMKYADDGGRTGPRRGSHDKNAVIQQTMSWRRRLVREVLVVLSVRKDE